MHNKQRRPNPMNGGTGGNGQQPRHYGNNNNNNNNRPRRFNNNNNRSEGGNDAASVTRTRRNATQSREKYQMMARDATQMGDRVLAENYLQYADHYHRVLLSLPPEEAPRQHYQPRHQNQQEGGQPGGEPQQQDASGGDEGHSQDSYAQHSNGGQVHQPHQQRQHGDASHHAPQAGHLPSFITQPGGQNPTDE